MDVASAIVDQVPAWQDAQMTSDVPVAGDVVYEPKLQ